jgi:hypothetical protein
MVHEDALQASRGGACFDLNRFTDERRADVSQQHSSLISRDGLNPSQVLSTRRCTD